MKHDLLLAISSQLQVIVGWRDILIIESILLDNTMHMTVNFKCKTSSLFRRLHIYVSVKAKKYELNSTKLWLQASAVFDCIAACLFLSQKWKDSWIYLPESAKVKRATWFSQNDISAWSTTRFVLMHAHTLPPFCLCSRLENYVTAVWRGYWRKTFSWQKPLPGSLASFFSPLFFPCILSRDSATPACVIFHQTFHLGSTAHLQRREKPYIILLPL